MGRRRGGFEFIFQTPRRRYALLEELRIFFHLRIFVHQWIIALNYFHF